MQRDFWHGCNTINVSPIVFSCGWATPSPNANPLTRLICLRSPRFLLLHPLWISETYLLLLTFWDEYTVFTPLTDMLIPLSFEPSHEIYLLKEVTIYGSYDGWPIGLFLFIYLIFCFSSTRFLSLAIFLSHGGRCKLKLFWNMGVREH